jgi:hypothetical protein
MICKKCTNEIPELNFSEEVLLEMRGLAAQDMKLFLVKKLLMDQLGVSHAAAKCIADHLNPQNGECLRCNFEGLEGENVECPECGAFNYNLAETPFNRDFCGRLEYALDFDNLGIEEVRGFWCDGVSAFPPDMKSLSKASVRETRQITTEAWVGKSGQERCRMIIQFGPKALEYYEKGFDLEKCIPESECKYWVKVDLEKETVIVRLD